MSGAGDYGTGLLVLLVVVAVLVWPVRWAPSVAATPTSATGAGRLPGTLASLAGRWRPTAGGVQADALADLLEGLVPALRAGASEAAAVEVVAGVTTDGPLGDLVAALSGAARSGAPLSPVWAATASAASVPGAGFVARAWALSEETGVPLALALDTAARSLRAQRSAERALAAATAGARASMVLLAILPATGPVIGLLFGLPPSSLYGSSASASCLAVGAVLALVGWWWSRSIVRKALRPSTIGGAT